MRTVDHDPGADLPPIWLTPDLVRDLTKLAKMLWTWEHTGSTNRDIARYDEARALAREIKAKMEG
jgi:hypothetical protein